MSERGLSDCGRDADVIEREMEAEFAALVVELVRTLGKDELTAILADMRNALAMPEHPASGTIH